MKQINLKPADADRRRAWLVGLSAWAIPGLGHLLLRRWPRFLLLGGSVWLMFLLGLALGGHLFSLGGPEQGLGMLVPALWTIGDIGSGLLYIFCWIMHFGFVDTPQAAAKVTFEYGNTFLVVAGLLNYLVMLDAFDIAVRRKQ